MLADCDVLVIKTPTRAFSLEEVAAIEAFVNRGGGLLLIGDHTNVFGTSTYLNPIARRFGLHFNADATYDLPTGGLTLYRRPGRLPHPVVQWMPPFLFGTSCTLDAPARARIPIAGYALRVAGHDYSTPSFFTAKTDGPYAGFGLFPQLAAVNAGRGRVLAFTDSTVFSNFWLFLPGKPELLLGCSGWLNRTNRFAGFSVVFGLWGAFLCLSSVILLRRLPSIRLPILAAALSAGCFLAVPVVGALNRRNYPLPSPHAPYRSICFDGQISDFDLPNEKLLLEPKRDFHTLYVWVQRLGYVPRVSSRLTDAIARDDGIVLLNPLRQPSRSEAQRLASYVKQGGVLFVLASPARLASANSILAPFEVRLEPEILRGQTILNAAGEVVARNRNATAASGGEGILFTAGHRTIVALKRCGKGTVVFGGDPQCLSGESLGTVNQVPDPEQRRLYEVVFNMFRQIEAGHSR